MLTHIDRRYLDAVWPTVAPVLQRAVEKNHGENDMAQLRAQIAFGGAHLLVWEAGEERTAVVAEFKQYANYRTAWVSYMSGALTAEALLAFATWARDMGASKIECLAGEAQARLFTKHGFHEAYRLMRYEL